MEKGTWKIVLKEDIPPNAIFLNLRFVLALMNEDSGKEVFKAPFVVWGHRDKNKDILIYESSTVKQSSTRLLIAVAAIFRFNVWSHDLRQADLLSSIWKPTSAISFTSLWTFGFWTLLEPNYPDTFIQISWNETCKRLCSTVYIDRTQEVEGNDWTVCWRLIFMEIKNFLKNVIKLQKDLILLTGILMI